MVFGATTIGEDKMKLGKKWIGVDFDRTLSTFDRSMGISKVCGQPIPAMVDRIQKWVAAGKTVKIFTARVSPHPHLAWHDPKKVEKKIQDWLEKYGMPRLEVTCVKDFLCEALWDDKAVSVERDTAKLLTVGPVELIESGDDWQSVLNKQKKAAAKIAAQ